MSDIYDPEDWATCIVRALATILMVTKGEGVPSVMDFLRQLLGHDVFLRHLIGMKEAASALVLKAAVRLAPIDAAIVANQVADVRVAMEC